MDSKEKYLIASYGGCGSSWLLNIVVELGIPVYRNMIEDTWSVDETGFLLVNESDPLKQWMPALMKYDRFAFGNHPGLAFTHSLPKPENAQKKIILFIRDGRDTIFSQYRRERPPVSFNQFLSEHAPAYGCVLPYPETWALFYFAWMQSTPQKDLLIVRFEDTKKDPLESARRIANFLNIDATEDKIKMAVAESSFQKAKESETKFLKIEKNPVFVQGLRKGMVQEWKETFAKDDLDLFSGFPNRVLDEFGYQSTANVTTNNVHIDIPKQVIERVADDWAKILCETGDAFYTSIMMKVINIIMRHKPSFILPGAAKINYKMKIKQFRNIVHQADLYVQKNKFNSIEMAKIHFSNNEPLKAANLMIKSGVDQWKTIMIKEFYKRGKLKLCRPWRFFKNNTGKLWHYVRFYPYYYKLDKENRNQKIDFLRLRKKFKLLYETTSVFTAEKFIMPLWDRFNMDLAKKILPEPNFSFLKNKTIQATMVALGDDGDFRMNLAYLKKNCSHHEFTALLKEDYVGMPELLDTKYLTSHTTVHNLYHLIRYRTETSANFNNLKSIVEWGGGYGNLAKIVNRMIFGPITYILIDTPLFSCLQWLYLSSIFGEKRVHIVQSPSDGIMTNMINIVPIGLLKYCNIKCDLLISTWALSESSATAQDYVFNHNWFGAKGLLFAYQKNEKDLPDSERVAEHAFKSGAILKPIGYPLRKGNYYAFL